MAQATLRAGLSGLFQSHFSRLPENTLPCGAPPLRVKRIVDWILQRRTDLPPQKRLLLRQYLLETYFTPCDDDMADFGASDKPTASITVNDKDPEYDWLYCPFLRPSSALPRYTPMGRWDTEFPNLPLQIFMNQLEWLVTSKSRTQKPKEQKPAYTCWNNGRVYLEPEDEAIWDNLMGHALSNNIPMQFAEIITDTFKAYGDFDWACRRPMTPQECFRMAQAIQASMREFFPKAPGTEGTKLIVMSSQYRQLPELLPSEAHPEGRPPLCKTGLHTIWCGEDGDATLVMNKRRMEYVVAGWRKALKETFTIADAKDKYAFENVIIESPDAKVYDNGLRAVGSTKPCACKNPACQDLLREWRDAKKKASKAYFEGEEVAAAAASETTDKDPKNGNSMAAFFKAFQEIQCPNRCYFGKLEDSSAYMPMFVLDWQGHRDRKFEQKLLKNMAFLVKATRIRCHKPLTEGFFVNSGLIASFPKEAEGTMKQAYMNKDTGETLNVEEYIAAPQETKAKLSLGYTWSSLSSVSRPSRVLKYSPSDSMNISSGRRSFSLEELMKKHKAAMDAIGLDYRIMTACLRDFLRDPTTFQTEEYLDLDIYNIYVHIRDRNVRIDSDSNYCQNVEYAHQHNHVFFTVSEEGAVQKCGNDKATAFNPKTHTACTDFVSMLAPLPKHSRLATAMSLMFDVFAGKKLSFNVLRAKRKEHGETFGRLSLKPKLKTDSKKPVFSHNDVSEDEAALQELEQLKEALQIEDVPTVSSFQHRPRFPGAEDIEFVDDWDDFEDGDFDIPLASEFDEDLAADPLLLSLPDHADPAQFTNPQPQLRQALHAANVKPNTKPTPTRKPAVNVKPHDIAVKPVNTAEWLATPVSLALSVYNALKACIAAFPGTPSHPAPALTRLTQDLILVLQDNSASSQSSPEETDVKAARSIHNDDRDETSDLPENAASMAEVSPSISNSTLTDLSVQASMTPNRAFFYLELLTPQFQATPDSSSSSSSEPPAKRQRVEAISSSSSPSDPKSISTPTKPTKPKQQETLLQSLAQLQEKDALQYMAEYTCPCIGAVYNAMKTHWQETTKGLPRKALRRLIKEQAHYRVRFRVIWGLLSRFLAQFQGNMRNWQGQLLSQLWSHVQPQLSYIEEYAKDHGTQDTKP